MSLIKEHSKFNEGEDNLQVEENNDDIANCISSEKIPVMSDVHYM